MLQSRIEKHTVEQHRKPTYLVAQRRHRARENETTERKTTKFRPFATLIESLPDSTSPHKCCDQNLLDLFTQTLPRSAVLSP